jgi:hypothetical protein
MQRKNSCHHNKGSVRIPYPGISPRRNACRSLWEVPNTCARSEPCADKFYKTPQKKKHFTKIRSAILELFEAYGRTDGTISTGTPQGCERASKRADRPWNKELLQTLLDWNLRHNIQGLVVTHLRIPCRGCNSVTAIPLPAENLEVASLLQWVTVHLMRVVTVRNPFSYQKCSFYI